MQTLETATKGANAIVGAFSAHFASDADVTSAFPTKKCNADVVAGARSLLSPVAALLEQSSKSVQAASKDKGCGPTEARKVRAKLDELEKAAKGASCCFCSLPLLRSRR